MAQAEHIRRSIGGDDDAAAATSVGFLVLLTALVAEIITAPSHNCVMVA